MKAEKLFLVLYLICIFLGVCPGSQRQAFLPLDHPRGTNVRELLPKNNETPNPPNFNLKHMKSSRATNESTLEKVTEMVDDALGKFVAYIHKMNAGKMELPNMSTTYESDSGFFTVNVVFTAKEGSFSNLTTMKRTSQPVIRRRGKKIELLCSFGPRIAHVEYNYVNVVYGFMNMDGELVANLSPLILAGKVSADYSKTPCVARLEQLKVVRMGPITTIVSGMGMFSGSVQEAVDDYIKNSYNKLRRMIAAQTGKIIVSRLPLFDCEAFRYFLELV